MAIFGIGKKKREERPKSQASARAHESATEKEKEEKVARATPVAKDTAKAVAIIRPRITEKATIVTEHGAYVFEIHPHATKRDVARAVESLYQVTPRKVNIVRLPRKNILSSRRGGIAGRTSQVKKAYVYLPEGKSIELV